MKVVPPTIAVGVNMSLNHTLLGKMHLIFFLVKDENLLSSEKKHLYLVLTGDTTLLYTGSISVSYFQNY